MTLSKAARVLRILLDTNIFAYIFATTSQNIVHRVRAGLAQGLLTLRGTVVLLYEEQIDEIHRAFDDLVVRGVITSDVKLEVIRRIREDFDNIVQYCRTAGKCIVVPRDDEYTLRAAKLYRILEQHLGRGGGQEAWQDKHGFKAASCCRATESCHHYARQQLLPCIQPCSLETCTHTCNVLPRL